MAILKKGHVKINGETKNINIGALAKNIIMENGNTLEQEIAEIWKGFELNTIPEEENKEVPPIE